MSKIRITIEIDHVVNDHVSDADLARGIAWAASKASAHSGDSDSEEMVGPSRLWLSYNVEALP